MRSSLRSWFAKNFPVYDAMGGRTDYGFEKMRRFDLAARRSPLADRLNTNGPERTFDSLEGDVILRIIDWMIMDTHVNKLNEKHEGVDRILRDGGSKWKVGLRDGVPGLETRVPEGVQDAADAVISTPGHAGTLLSEAWHAVFGVNPKPETGYRQAVLAVEAAAIPVVIPTDPTATLGKVFAAMRDQKDWALDIKKQHKDYPSTAVILGMVQMLWAGQGRHAGQPNWAPNTQAEAEAAVMLAVPLVQWFSSEAIARRP